MWALEGRFWGTVSGLQCGAWISGFREQSGLQCACILRQLLEKGPGHKPAAEDTEQKTQGGFAALRAEAHASQDS